MPKLTPTITLKRPRNSKGQFTKRGAKKTKPGGRAGITSFKQMLKQIRGAVRG